MKLLLLSAFAIASLGYCDPINPKDFEQPPACNTNKPNCPPS